MTETENKTEVTPGIDAAPAKKKVTPAKPTPATPTPTEIMERVGNQLIALIEQQSAAYAPTPQTMAYRCVPNVQPAQLEKTLNDLEAEARNRKTHFALLSVVECQNALTVIGQVF